MAISTLLGSIGTLSAGASPFSGLSIGSTPSKQFAGESSKDRRERKKFDKRRRRSGGQTSSMMWVEGLYWKDGKVLPEPYATNFFEKYGIRPEQKRREATLKRQGKEVTVIEKADGSKQVVAASPINKLASLPVAAYAAIIGGLFLIYNFMKPKKRGRRR